MQQRGRRSSAALAVIDETGHDHALVVPGSLSQAEQVVWMELVNSKPTAFFGSEHVPVMVEYVRHVCRGHVIDQQLQAFTPELLKTEEGLKRYGKLVDLAHKVAGMVKTLATSMRITQQSVYLKDKKSLGDRKPKEVWQRHAN